MTFILYVCPLNLMRKLSPRILVSLEMPSPVGWLDFMWVTSIRTLTREWGQYYGPLDTSG